MQPFWVIIEKGVFCFIIMTFKRVASYSAVLPKTVAGKNNIVDQKLKIILKDSENECMIRTTHCLLK